MYLQYLPVELGAIIVSYLDKSSKINAYSVFELRQFYVPSLMRKFDVSRCSAASVKTLSLDVFLDCAVHIHELNLSRIKDLTACQLSPHIKRCTNLKTLDITFTSIYLPDLYEYDICPDIVKNISVNFFKWPYYKRSHVWKKGIDLFRRKRFENVHLIVFESCSTHSPLMFMNGVPRTKNLKITITDNYGLRDNERPDVKQNIDANFEKLNFVYRDCEIEDELGALSVLDYNQMEYIFSMHGPRCAKQIDIYISPIFEPLFAKNFSDLKLKVRSHLPAADVAENGNHCIWFSAWNKSFTTFNHAFFKTVLTELTDFIPTYLCMHNKIEMKLTQAPSNWYCIDACQGFETILDNLPEKVTLTDFCRKKGRLIPTTDPVYLTPDSNTLKNITYLRLSDIRLRRDFFTTLFEQCKDLCTLDFQLEAPGSTGFEECMPSLYNSMHLTKSLKNIRLRHSYIEYELLFASLCQCPTLENIHIEEYGRFSENYPPADKNVDTKHMVLLIEKCLGLYSLFIDTQMSKENVDLLKTPLRAAAQQLGRDYLCIEVQLWCTGWNPFADVFNPGPLQISD